MIDSTHKGAFAEFSAIYEAQPDDHWREAFCRRFVREYGWAFLWRWVDWRMRNQGASILILRVLSQFCAR